METNLKNWIYIKQKYIFNTEGPNYILKLLGLSKHAMFMTIGWIFIVELFGFLAEKKFIFQLSSNEIAYQINLLTIMIEPWYYSCENELPISIIYSLHKKNILYEKLTVFLNILLNIKNNK